MIRNSLNIVTSTVNGLTTIVYVGQPDETPDTSREKALKVVDTNKGDDTYKNQLRSNLTVEPFSKFIDKF